MKRFILTILILTVMTGISVAQVTYELRQAMDLYRNNKIVSGDFKKLLTESDIEGSPYLNNEFVKGSIYTTSKTQYADIPLRYNIYNDDIEFKTEEGEINALATPEIVEKIEFAEFNMVYVPFSMIKKINRGYFIVLTEGKASLYSRAEVIFIKATEPGAYQDAKPANFQRKPDTYYIRIGQDVAKLVDNKKDLIDAFPDNQDKIEDFVKKNKTKTNSAESLKELVQYYNSL